MQIEWNEKSNVSAVKNGRKFRLTFNFICIILKKKNTVRNV